LRSSPEIELKEMARNIIGKASKVEESGGVQLALAKEKTTDEKFRD